jgi:hypothetical protein
MDKNNVLEWIEAEVGQFQLRDSGNEVAVVMSARIRPLIAAHREVAVAALRDLLSYRPVFKREPDSDDSTGHDRLWLALNIAADAGLTELRPDVEALIADVKHGRAFPPYYVEILERYVRRLA